MIKDAIKKIVQNQNLTQKEMETVFAQIMQGEATDAQIAAFIVALHLKGETIDEITAAAKTMRSFAEKIDVDADIILDTCGTGGSGLHTFNVSTLGAIIAASLGAAVAKHGNRSATSRSGSADLLEQLGVNITATPQIVKKCIDDIGIGFLFAPGFHKAMKYAIGPRKEVGIRTIFNVLGPLTNPAFATNQLMGVFGPQLMEPMVNVLANLGLKHALVVHSEDGMDEISTCAPTSVWELKNNKILNYTVSPDQFGIDKANIKDLQIADVEQGCGFALDILNNKLRGPVYDFVVLNAAFAVYTADLADDVNKAIAMVKDVLANGKALEKLELLKKYSNEIDS